MRQKNRRITVSPVDRTLGGVRCWSDGTFWVSTSRSWRDLPEGAIAAYDAFDREGRYRHRVIIKGEGIPPENDYYFKTGRDGLLVSQSGVSATLAAAGVSADTTDVEVDGDRPPSAIFYRITRAD